jgi:putative phage-type endonuclease
MTAFEMRPSPPAGSPEWLELRRTTGIGASESAQVIGKSKFGTATDLYCLKRGLVDSKQSTRAMRRGVAMEDFIMNEYMAETGILGYKPEYMAVSVDYPWMFANFDFMSNDGKLIAEMKCVRSADEWGESYSDTYPPEYWIQVQHQLAVSGFDKAHLVAFITVSDDLRIYEIPRNDAFIEFLARETNKFWHDNVLKGIAPEDGGNRESMMALYPVLQDELIEMEDEDLAKYVADYHNANTIIKNFEKQKETALRLIQAKIGEHKKVAVGGTKFTISQSETKGSQVSYWRKPSRIIRITEKKEKK